MVSQRDIRTFLKEDEKMKIKCEYCGNLVDDSNSVCPYCGATLPGTNRTAKKQPKTIEELKEWYVAMNLPPENVTRFFIGKDIRDPKAFGIYQDANGDFVVYKNKANGVRAVRYQGSDEEYAVNELYQRLREEIINQKNHNAERRSQRSRTTTGSIGKNLIIAFIIPIFIVILTITVLIIRDVIDFKRKIPYVNMPQGYYSYEGYEYYRQGNDWYYYTYEDDDWHHTVAEKIPGEVANDTEGQYHEDDFDGKDFKDTFWYHEPTQNSGNNSSNDRDDSYNDNDDYDWDTGWDDNDTWDTGDTDWDSDW